MYWQVGLGLVPIQPDTAFATYRTAWTTMQAADPKLLQQCDIAKYCSIAGLLQQQLLSAMMESPGFDGHLRDIESLMVEEDAATRTSSISEMVSHLVEKPGSIPQAQRLLLTYADDKNFPYDAAIQLMEALRGKDAQAMASVFSEAAANYRQHGESPEAVRQEDLATALLRFSQDIPRDQALDAVAEILSQARENSSFVTAFTGSGNRHFDSLYEFRLYELLPVLRELDPSRRARPAAASSSGGCGDGWLFRHLSRPSHRFPVNPSDIAGAQVQASA